MQIAGACHRILTLLAVFAALASGSLPAQAQAFPTKPIQLVVPWPPGGSADRAMRLTADAVTKKMGVPVVVVNKPGAGGTMGLREAMSSKPDGYTLAMIGDGAIFAQYNNPSANSIDDMVPLVFFGDDPLAITVHPKTGFKNLRDFVAYAKANPGKLKNGNDQPGGSSAVAAQIFEKELGVRLTKIPYAGFAATVQGLLAGEVDSASVPLLDVIEHHNAGKLRVLGVPSARRHFKAPDVPTFVEQGFNVNATVWRMIVAPKGTPPERLKILESRFLAAMSEKDFLEKARAAGFVVSPLGVTASRKRWEEHDRKTYPLFEEAGLVKTRRKK